MTERTTITRAQLAAMIDDTLLEPEVTDDDVVRLAKEAEQFGTGAICISPSRLPLAEGVLAPGIRVVAVAASRRERTRSRSRSPRQPPSWLRAPARST